MPVVWFGVTAEHAAISDPSRLNATDPPTGMGTTAAEYVTNDEVGTLGALAVSVVVDDAIVTTWLMAGDSLARNAAVPAKRAMIEGVPLVRREAVVQVAMPLTTADASQPGMVALFALKSTEPLVTPGKVAVNVTDPAATIDDFELATVMLDTWALKAVMTTLPLPLRDEPRKRLETAVGIA
jgi:hypothetical protein